ncbi:hypothetical protein Tco_1103079 [Tanacetum coccineum]
MCQLLRTLAFALHSAETVGFANCVKSPTIEYIIASSSTDVNMYSIATKMIHLEASRHGTDAEMINVQQGNENLETTLNQVIEDAHVTLSTVAKKTEVPVTSSSHSSELTSKFLKFSNIPHTDAEFVSSMDVHVHHEVPSNQLPTLLTVPVSVITESSPVYTTVISQSLPSFTPTPPQSTPTPPPKTEATNPLYALPNFASVF